MQYCIWICSLGLSLMAIHYQLVIIHMPNLLIGQNLYQILKMLVIRMHLFCRRRMWSLERLNDLPKATQLISDKVWMKIQICWTWKAWFSSWKMEVSVEAYNTGQLMNDLQASHVIQEQQREEREGNWSSSAMEWRLHCLGNSDLLPVISLCCLQVFIWNRMRRGVYVTHRCKCLRSLWPVYLMNHLKS